MTLDAVLVLCAALLGVGLYGALSQQSFVMLLMGIELMLGAVMLAGIALWALTAEGNPEGQLLVIVVLAVMAVEMTVGFALVAAVYRTRRTDTTDSLNAMKH